jgi:hypothetical protein
MGYVFFSFFKRGKPPFTYAQSVDNLLVRNSLFEDIGGAQSFHFEFGLYVGLFGGRL